MTEKDQEWLEALDIYTDLGYSKEQKELYESLLNSDADHMKSDMGLEESMRILGFIVGGIK